MAREELLPLSKTKDRPATLTIDGWTVFVSIRDIAYMATLKQWRKKLAAAHPDRGGSGRKFRLVMGDRLRWQCAEAKWYASLGLLPPDGFDHAKDKLDRTKRLKGLDK